jgi:hypothetical protein
VLVSLTIIHVKLTKLQYFLYVVVKNYEKEKLLHFRWEKNPFEKKKANGLRRNEDQLMRRLLNTINNPSEDKTYQMNGHDEQEEVDMIYLLKPYMLPVDFPRK